MSVPDLMAVVWVLAWLAAASAWFVRLRAGLGFLFLVQLVLFVGLALAGVWVALLLRALLMVVP